MKSCSVSWTIRMLKAQACSIDQRVVTHLLPFLRTMGRDEANGAGMRQNSLRSESLLCPFLLKSIWVAHTGQNHTDTVPAGSARAGPHPMPTRGLAAVFQYSHHWARCSPLWKMVRRAHTAAEPEAPSLCPPDRKSRSIRKDFDAGKDWRQRRRGQQRMRGWMHHQHNGHDSGQTLGRREDRGAWPAAAHGLRKSWTGLSDWTTTGTKVVRCKDFLCVQGPSPDTGRGGRAGTSVGGLWPCLRFYIIRTH